MGTERNGKDGKGLDWTGPDRIGMDGIGGERIGVENIPAGQAVRVKGSLISLS